MSLRAWALAFQGILFLYFLPLLIPFLPSLLQMSPEGGRARNMANDTMLHCALKAQPNNKARPLVQSHTCAFFGDANLAARGRRILMNFGLFVLQVLLKLLIDHGAEVAATGADQMTCEEMLLARHHKVSLSFWLSQFE